jgi:hypothetical protein
MNQGTLQAKVDGVGSLLHSFGPVKTEQDLLENSSIPGTLPKAKSLEKFPLDLPSFVAE